MTTSDPGFTLGHVQGGSLIRANLAAPMGVAVRTGTTATAAPPLAGGIRGNWMVAPRRPTLVTVLAAVVGAIGGLALVGWIFDLSPLTEVIPGSVGMKANAAVALLLLAAGIALAEGSGMRRALAGAAAGAAALIAGLSLLEYAVGNLGIDQLLFSDPQGVSGASPAGRMAPFTAVVLLLLAVGIGTWTRTRSQASQLVATLAGVTAFIALIGYVFGDSRFYEPVGHSAMAVNTAVAVLLASTAVVIGAGGRLSSFLVAGDGTTVLARRALAGMVLLCLGFALLGAHEAQTGVLSATIAITLICLFTVVTMAGAVVTGVARVRGIEEAGLSEQHVDTERESAASATTEKARELEVLRRLSVATAGLVDENALAGLAVAGAIELVRADGAVLRWYEPDTDSIRRLSTANGQNLGDESIPALGSALGEAILTRAAVLINDYDTSERIDEKARLPEVKALLAVPLLLDRVPVGAMGVVSFGDRKFELSEATPLSLLGLQVAAAIAAARLHSSLLASEERFRGAFEDSGIGMILIGPSRTMLRVNDAACGVLGFSAEVLVGKRLRDFADPAGLVSLDPAIARIRAGDLAQDQAELLFRKADGSSAWARLHLSLMRDVEDKGGRTILVQLEDITSAKEADEAVHAGRALLAEVLSSAPILLFALDLEGRITLAEGSLATRTVASSAALIGLDLRERFKGEPTATTHLERALAGETFSGQIDLPSLGRWLEVSYAPIFDSVGSMIGSSWLAVDVSDRANAAAAQRDSELKTRLVATVNHEVRTPLSAVLGFTELLITERAGPLNDKQKRYLGNIDTAGRHLLDLINDSLDLSKIAAGRMDLQLSVLDLRPFLDRAAEQVAPIARKKTISLVVEAGANALVLADNRKLLQVVWNLLSNSIRHTPDNGCITLSGIPVGDHIEIAVRDTGIGIPEDQLERIFEEYSQVGKSNGGTGLGLPVSRKLARLMNGDLRVSSHLGVGSTFTITLPAGSLAA